MESTKEKAMTAIITTPCCHGSVKKLALICWISETTASPVAIITSTPGHQAQIDVAEFRLPWGKRYALLVVLGYSRLMWLQFYTRQTMAVLMGGLEDAFAFFGGVLTDSLSWRWVLFVNVPIGIAVMVGVPVVYSYWLWRREKRAAQASG